MMPKPALAERARAQSASLRAQYGPNAQTAEVIDQLLIENAQLRAAVRRTMLAFRAWAGHVGNLDDVIDRPACFTYNADELAKLLEPGTDPSRVI